jgi:DNA repair protein RecO (recombination protein O)
MLEAVDQVAQEREPNPALYRMLLGALHTLAERPSPLVSTAFFWKLLSLEGFHPMLHACARCGDDTGPFTSYDLNEGGVLCERCAPLGGHRVEPETLTVIDDIISGRLARILAAPPPASVLTEIERLAIRAIEYHSERRLRSAALL